MLALLGSNAQLTAGCCMQQDDMLGEQAAWTSVHARTDCNGTSCS